MKYVHTLLKFTLILSAACGLSAFDWPEALTTSEQTQINERRSTPEIQEVEASGMKAWLVHDDSQPLFSIQLVFEGAGSSSDPENLEGRAMFATALLDEGAGELDALAFQQAVDARAIELSFDTDQDALIVTMRSLSENKEEAFRLLGLALNQPRFDADAITRKRAQALSVLKQAQTNPAYIMSRRFKTLAYPNHPYGRDAMGTETSLKKLSQTDFKHYVQSMIAKDNLVISAAGDLDAATLKTLLEKHLSSITSNAARPEIAPITLQHLHTLDVVRQPIPQSMILFATPAISREDPRFIAGYVLNHIIGGDSLNSKLGIAIRKEKGLAYSVNSNLNPMRYSSSWGGMFATRNEQAGEALKTLTDVADRIREDGLSEEDLARTKSYLTGAFVRSLDTNGELANYLSIMQRFHLGKDYLATRNAKIEAVTLADINALAQEWLNTKKWLIVVVGEPKTNNVNSEIPTNGANDSGAL